jgi:surfeit locus 1 family protein
LEGRPDRPARRGRRAAPIAPPQTLAEAQADQFRHIVAEGTFQNDKELFLAASSDNGDSGYQVLTPLAMTDGRTMFVNRGFIPLELKDRRNAPPANYRAT